MQHWQIRVSFVKPPGCSVLDLSQTVLINNQVFQRFIPSSKSKPPLVMYNTFHFFVFILYLYNFSVIYCCLLIAKSQYYRDAVVENVHQPKILWKWPKDMGLTGKCNTNLCNIGIEMDNTMCFDKQKISGNFNNYFTSIASLVCKAELPKGSGRFGLPFLNNVYPNKNTIPNTSEMGPVSVETVMNMLSSLCTNKAAGLDLIPA